MKEFKLPKKVKEKWIKALRSGKYQQGTGRLHNKYEDTYCCLGVLAEVCKTYKGNSKNTFISNKKLLPQEIQSELSSRNDGDHIHGHFSFKQISNWIKKNL